MKEKLMGVVSLNLCHGGASACFLNFGALKALRGQVLVKLPFIEKESKRITQNE